MTDQGQSKTLPIVERDSSREGPDLSRYLYRPVVFQEPDRLVGPPPLLEHIPFAFWIVDALRPGCLVELGTQTGNSYAAFAQAVAVLRLATACYSIDTGNGDFSEWRDYHDRHFSAFSSLIRAPSSEAVKQFADGTIDLLHINGGNASDSLPHDFAVWLPKMSHRGVVLLHDVNVRGRGFGPSQLWHQVETTYPSFAFLHGDGLGVLGVGRDVPEPIQWLLSRASASSEVTSEIRLFFSRLGRRLSLQHECTRHQQTIRALRSQLQDGGSTIPGFETDLPSPHVRSDDERDQTIRELDAEARGFASQLERARAGMSGRLSVFQQRVVTVRSRLKSVRRSRLARAMTTFKTMPTVIGWAAGRGWRGSVRALGRFATRPGRLKEAARVAGSGLFDQAYYLAQYPDVDGSRVHPMIHYVLWGAFEGRRPNALFDPAFYLEHYPDVARAGHEPLGHFALRGASEQRNPGPHFDSRYYLAMNPDVRDAGGNPLTHFLKEGWRQGRSPSPSFDPAGYVARYEDVRSSGLDPLLHYLEIGHAQGRDASPLAEAPLPALPRVRMTSQPISGRQRENAAQPLLVCLTHVSPWPPHAGNAYRIHRMLKWLQHAGFRIVPIIVPLAGETPDDEAVRNVKELFSNVVVVERTGSVRYSLADAPDVLASLDGEHTARYSALLGEERSTSARERELLTIDRTYCPDAAIAAVLRLQSVLGPHVFLAEYVWMTRVLPLIDERAVKVVDTHDVFSTKVDKVLRFGIKDLWLSEEEEARRLSRADLVIAIQEEEHRILQRLVPERPVLTAGIDFDVVGMPLLPQAHRILYLASGNAMNVRGLRDFLRFAWPSIVEKVPDAELLVAGAVSASLEGDVSGVRRLGRVQDLDGLYRSVRVVINPALAGTGGKIKTVEALSQLRPIVTFPTGVEGLPRELIDLCDVVQDWYEFGPSVAGRLLDGREEAFSSTERQRIEHATSPQAVYADLSASLLDLCQRRAAATSERPAVTT